MAGIEANSCSIFVLAINADATDRKGTKLHDTPENNSRNLVNGLKELVDIARDQMKEKPSIVTISEMGATSKMPVLMAQLNEGLDSREVADGHKGWNFRSYRLNSNDGIATVYDQSVFEILEEPANSDQGRYQVFKLQMKSSRVKLLYFSLHLPHKNGKKNAYKSLKETIDNLSEGFDAVLIGGDWNIEPQALLANEEFQELNLNFALSTSDGSTSKSGTTIDNFAIYQNESKESWKVSFADKKIMREQQITGNDGYTTHAPIWAKVEFNRTVGTAAESNAEGSSSGAQATSKKKVSSPGATASSKKKVSSPGATASSKKKGSSPGATATNEKGSSARVTETREL